MCIYAELRLRSFGEYCQQLSRGKTLAVMVMYYGDDIILDIHT